MPDPNDFDKQQNKARISSFISGILQSKNQNIQRNKQIEYEQSIYDRGRKDKNFGAQLKFLQDLTENPDPKIQAFAYQELSKMGAISKAPEQTPVNELAQQIFGLSPGQGAAYINRGYSNPDAERYTIQQGSFLAKIDPNLVGKELSVSEIARIAAGVDKSNKYYSYMNNRPGNKWADVEQERKLLETKRKNLETQLKIFPRDFKGNIVTDDPKVQQMSDEYDYITYRLSQLGQTVQSPDNKKQSDMTQLAKDVITAMQEYKKAIQGK